MDWNVFFSTVSQTCGAVVGIFSAFLITKIIADQSQFSEIKKRVGDNVSESERLKTRIDSLDLKDVNESHLSALKRDLAKRLAKEETMHSAEHYYNQSEHPKYASRQEVVDIIQAAIDSEMKERKKREEAEAKRIKEAEIQAEIDKLKRETISAGCEHFGNLFNNKAEQGWASRLLNMDRTIIEPVPYVAFSTQEQIYMAKQKQSMDDLIEDALHQSKLNQRLLADLDGTDRAHNLISSSLLVVLALFFIGVIYPLSFLPLIPNAEINLSVAAFWDILFSLKGGMLSVLSVSFTWLILKFWLFNRNLRLTKEELLNLAKFSKVEGFSEYLKNYEEHKIRAVEPDQ